MRRVMAICFWVCVACAIAGATVALLRVWGLATEYEVREIIQTIQILFVAAVVTLIISRISFGKGLKPEGTTAGSM